MSHAAQRTIYWTPRVLCFAFAAFLSIFALDVFGEHLPFARLLLALFMHLVPTLVLLVLLAFSWKWEWIGGVGFIGLGIYYYVWMMHGRHFLVALPALVIGVLFFANWIWRNELKSSAKAI
jgi:hypothetical protein